MSTQMHFVSACPICEGGALDAVHQMTLRREDFSSPEEKRRKSNTYHRNFVLFQRIVDADEITVRFLRCEGCGFVFFSPRPSGEDLAVKYDLVAAEGDTEAREELRRLVDLRERRGRAVAGRLEPYLVVRSGRAVDLGGADGHCLRELVEDYDCGVLDFEDRKLVAGVRRLGSSLGDLVEDDLFDLCITNHTLEHIPDPRTFVAEIGRHMAEGGLLYVEVPLGVNGEIYRTSNLLTHLNFFSEGSLGYLLEDCGFEVVDMRTGPVLSRNRYLPVVSAVARWTDGGVSAYYRERAASISREWEERSVGLSVFLANARLIARSPLRYTRAYLRRRGQLRRLSLAGGAGTTSD